MANTLTNLIMTYLMPMALPVLREASIMPALVYTDLSEETAQKNGTIRIPKPQSFAVNDSTPSSGSTIQALDDDKVDMTLDKWKHVALQMDDGEMVKVLPSGVLPCAVDAAMKTLASAIGSDLLR